jgi:polar amino acid transport system substrate-binding protein
LRLIVRDGDKSIRSWDDLRGTDGRPGKRVGVLRGTVAERYMRQQFGNSIEVIPTREVDETFQLLQGGERLDATVQDSPAATYFVEQKHLSGLRVVGEPVCRGYYVILTRPGDAQLRERLNDAIRKGARSDTLKQIYSKYGLWGPEQESEASGFQEARITLGDLWSKLLQAAGMTVALSICAMPLAILLGILVAVGRLYGPWPVRLPLAIYVELLRGTPVLLQLYVLFFLLPLFAHWLDWQPLIALATLPPFVVGVAGLAINYSAYEAENYRAGLLAVPRGQMEAALALGIRPRTALCRIILPQAIRIVIPPVTNDFIALFKDTSICSLILITELTGLYYQYKFDRAVALQLALVISVLYLLMSYPLSILSRKLETKLSPTPK